jgi:hypothetical protein
MHTFFDFFLVALVAGWAFDSMVNRRIDARLRDAATPKPTRVKARSPTLRESLFIVASVAFVLTLIALAGPFMK